MAWIIITLVLVASLLANLLLWRQSRRVTHRVRFLLDAVDSGDYSFRFPVGGKRGNMQVVNETLNRVKSVLSHARDEQIEKEKFYECILDSVDTGILVVEEARGVVIQSNQAARKMLQRDPITHISQVEDLLRRFSCRQSHTLLRGKNMRIMAFSDIHDELANQEIDAWVKLIRVLTHEIMNTVTPVISLSETLLSTADGQTREGLQVIHKTSTELVQFVENYRQFTRVPVPAPELFYVKPFLERQVQLLVHGAGQQRQVSLAVTPDDLLVYADEGLVSRVVSNLLKNAAEATGPRGHIALRAYTDSRDNVTLDITNDGPAIPTDVAAHIFVPFFTTKVGGNGIGLSISRRIMRASNGALELAENADGHVTFRLIFL